MIEILSVGKKAPEPYWNNTRKNRTESILEQSIDGHWMMLCYMPNLTKGEIEAYKKTRSYHAI